jgi:G:T-mismatch repair DNA endonuclease (very short patch repair protein)
MDLQRQGYRALYIWRCGVCAQQQSVMAPTHSLPSEIVEIGEHYDGV